MDLKVKKLRSTWNNSCELSRGEWNGVINKKEYDAEEEANMDLAGEELMPFLRIQQFSMAGWRNMERKIGIYGPALNDPKYFEEAGIAFRKKTRIGLEIQ